MAKCDDDFGGFLHVTGLCGAFSASGHLDFQQSHISERVRVSALDTFVLIGKTKVDACC